MKNLYYNKDTYFKHLNSGRSIVKDYLHIWRTLDECEIFFVLEGKVFIEQAGTKFCLQKGDYLIVEGNVPYGGYENSNGVFHWVHFILPKGKAVFSAKQENFDFFIPQKGNISSSDSLFVILVLLEQYALIPQKVHATNALLNALLCDLQTLAEKNSSVQTKDIRFWPIIEYFHNNPYYNEFKDVKSMAEYFGYSEKYLIALFKRNTGMSPLQYLTEKKIMRAQEMLVMTDMTVKAIASALHYDYYYFMRLFHKKVGMSPTQFRKNAIPNWDTLVAPKK